VSVKGIVHALPDGGRRKFKAAQLTVASAADIAVVTPVPDDPFDVPQILNDESGIENRQYKSASFVSRMNRRRAEGRVIAVSRGRRLLLKTAAGRLFSADITSGPPPRCGEHVAVVGFPETDLFILNLGKALCRKIPDDVNTVDSVAEEQEPIRLSPAFVMDKVLRECYGQVIGLRGTVVTVPSDNQDTSTVFGLACGNRLIPVDASACPSALNAIRDTARGIPHFSPEIRQALNEGADDKAFTKRQMEVLDSITRGLSNDDIALMLGISKSRVKQHLNEVYEKLGASNRAEAVAIAMRRQLLKS
jgi:DNA-binding CsgD family transcriptional regulator